MRDQKIDILRFIGLALIILAHSGVGGIFFQARNFDVPLMVLISGLSFQLAFKSEPYSEYLIKRIMRLVLPVWIFLTFYFLISYLIDPNNSQLNSKTISESYLFLGGIGYVWIIRVFLLVALIAPFIYSISHKQPSNFKFMSIVAIVYISYELLYAFISHQEGGIFSVFFEATVFYMLPYAVVFSIGLRLPLLARRGVFVFLGLMLLVFITLGYLYYNEEGKLIVTQLYKYPPRAYYLSYAIFVSLLAWIYIDSIILVLNKVKLLSLIDFAGRNTIWMYLWHIPLVGLISLTVYLKYPIILTVSFLLTFLQIKLFRSVVFPKLKSDRLKRNLNLIFTG